jgi:hypothetical protein
MIRDQNQGKEAQEIILNKLVFRNNVWNKDLKWISISNEKKWTLNGIGSLCTARKYTLKNFTYGTLRKIVYRGDWHELKRE